MLILKKNITICLLFFSCLVSYGQIKDIGIHSIINHERVLSKAGTQNWCIAQSDRGFIYFANNDGILEFNGTGWNIYPLPDSQVVRSVMAAGDSVFAGAFEEIGYLGINEKGTLEWHSLNHLIPEKYKKFEEVWNVYSDDNRIIFQSFSYIFIYEDGAIKVIEPPSELSLMHNAGNRLFVADKDNGLMVLEGDSLELVNSHPVFFHNEIRFVLPYKEDRYIIGTSNEGVFVLNGEKLFSWEPDINKHLINDNLYSGIRLSGGGYAFGTIRNGLYITNAQGRLLQHVNRYKGLQNNTILSIFEDNRNNLWLGLDNGIDFVDLSSPLTFINYNYNIESSYTSIIFNDILYIGTNQGLYAASIDNLRNSPDTEDSFTLISGTEGQVWRLEIIDNSLLCGHNFGSFQVEGFRAKQISDIRGFWSFLKPPGLSDTIIAGTYTGLVRLKRENGEWYFLDEIKGFRESSRSMFFDQQDNLWIAHGYRGLFKLDFSPGYSTVENAKLYYNSHGLPESLPYNIQIVNNKMHISTHEGIFNYDHLADSFIVNQPLSILFGQKGFIDKIFQDKENNLWYFTNDYLGVLRLLDDGVYRDITAPFYGVNDHLIPAFHNIFISDNENVFIGSQKGLAHYNPTILKDYNYLDNLFFTDITFYGSNDTVSYKHFSDVILKSDQETPGKPFSLNSVAFRFTTPAFENPIKNRFSWRLLGHEEKWSDWESMNFKEYTNLYEGNYIFEVKAMNAFGTESNIRRFHFTIEPPFLRSKTAYILYTIVLLIIISVNVYYVRRRILRIRLRERLKHEKRLAKKEEMFKKKTALSEKEIMQIRNESLHNEMKHKNKELANITFHLIQKNRTLTGLQDELNELLKNLPDDNPQIHNVRSLLKKVKKDLHNKKNWELFDNYFDEVHQDFINRLKKEYSNLSPKELRLCAYLRMNLSTKEIAPLMNISIRGVEISRYRLRKKLSLDHKTNLTDYIISY